MSHIDPDTGAGWAPSTLISAPALAAALAGPTPPVVLDASFDLADPEAGRRAHAAGHVPGAIYVHLDQDLSGPKTRPAPATDPAGGLAQGGAPPAGPFRGRHPLPAREAFAAAAGGWGITPSTPVVVVDRQAGVMASRAWWLLRWLGHRDVRVLDGGMAAWQAHGGALDATAPSPRPAPPYPAVDAATAAVLAPTIEADALRAVLGRRPLLDARAPERYRGEVEPLDACAGHIPGARNRPFTDNLGPDRRFKPVDVLRADYSALLGGQPPTAVVQQCGSGVTACHNLLAMEAAGLAGSALYPGSWSEWSSDPARPVARG